MTIAVQEPDANNAFNWETDYSYDTLNNLTNVTQKGGSTDSNQWRVRNFSYDGLSRLTQETTPEAGTVTLAYGGGCSGNPSLPCSRTDARGITTTYHYDALNRLTSKTYSDSTPAVTYYYDQTSYNGLTITNGKGRRTGMSDGTGATAWSYDVIGRVLTRRQTISGITKNTSFTYDLAGNRSSLTYPSGRVVNYSYNNAGQPVSATDGGTGKKYVSNAHYNAAGMISSMYDGETTGWISVTRTNTFNNRLQLTREQATSPVPLTLLDLSFSYDQGGGANNGLLVKVTNNRDNSRSITYAYDQLNRLSSAQTASTWGDSFVYDPWGNLLQKNPIKGTNTEQLTVTVNAKNQINTSGFTYDASGNLTWDQINSLAFNAENQATPPSGTTYGYDGDGRRVVKATKNLYWVGDSLEPLTLTDTIGNPQKDFIFLGGQRVATVVTSTGNPYYYLTDQVGSTSVVSSGDGKAISWEADYFPYGGLQIITNNLTNPYRFTGYENDTETGNNYAVFRYESANLGRFLSADPIHGDISNPQSWNRYAYVANIPTSSIDPVGMKRMPLWKLMDDEGLYSGMGITYGGTIDGLDAPNLLINGILSSGAGVQCPNNQCTRVGSSGLQYFWISTNGPGGYYNYSGPGALFYSLAAAQRAGALSDFNSMASDGIHQEWGNTAYQDANGVYSFTAPEIIGPPCAESQGCEGQLSLTVPDGTSLAGVQHSHPWVGGSGQFDYDAEQLMTGGYKFLDYVTGPSSNGSSWGVAPRTFVIDPNVPSVCLLSGPSQFGIQSCH